jgi:hypothetical protein
MSAIRGFFTETENLVNVLFRSARGELSELFWEIANLVKNRADGCIQTSPDEHRIQGV